jgi:hypothetical protein
MKTPETSGQCNNHHHRLMQMCLALLLAAVPTTSRAQMALKGKLLLAEDFQSRAEYPKERQPVQDGWQVRAAHAKWERTAAGVRSIWEKGHMPVLAYDGNFSNAVIEVDFRFEPEAGRWGGCRVSAANPELNPRAYAVSVWANSDGSGHDRGRPQGVLLEHDEWSAGPERVAHANGSFAPNTWHTLRLECLGTNALASCNGITAFGSHEKFGLAKKSIYLGVGTSRHELRRLRVYEARPNPEWKPPAGLTSQPRKNQ